MMALTISSRKVISGCLYFSISASRDSVLSKESWLCEASGPSPSKLRSKSESLSQVVSYELSLIFLACGIILEDSGKSRTAKDDLHREGDE